MSHHEVLSRAHFQAAADQIRAQTAHRPKIGLILGSGLNPLADRIIGADRIPYAEIPGFPLPTVPGHVGQLVVGELSGRQVLMMQGRVHAYEGYSPQRLTLPVRVMHELGIKILVVSNAAGGLNPAYRAGELMLIKDHIGLMALTGGNPLWGPNDSSLGPRFPAMSQAYDRELRVLARSVAEQLGIPLHEGVYAGLGGPTFETPAEVRFLRLIGADAAGMSTVPEVIVARHMGLRVLAFSGISNMAIDDPDAVEMASHEEVLEAGKILVPRLMGLLEGVLAELEVG